MKHPLRKLAFATPVLLMSAIASVHAQERTAILEEIIITAEKREATLSDTAVSISAFTSESMKDLNITNAADYEALVPSLTYQQSPNQLSIRGVGRFSNSLGVNPGVAIYNDYAYTAEATALATRPMNTERVEVLRGPQGTLYGRNTTGGAVNVITRRPTQEMAFEAGLTLGDYGTKEAEMFISGPLTDTFRAKLYANSVIHDGFQENLSGDDADTDDTQYVEAQISWDISENLNLMLKYGLLSYDYIAGYSVLIGGAPGMTPWDRTNPARSALVGSAQYDLPAGVENPSISRNSPYFVNVNSVGHTTLDDSENITMHLTWDLANAQVKYIFNSNSYIWNQKDIDGDGTPLNYSVNDVGQYQDQMTHEVQIVSDDASDFSWLVGAYLFSDENEQPFAFRAPELASIANIVYGGVPAIGVNPELYTYYQNAFLESDSFALYGEMGFDLSDELALKVGLRYSEDEMNGKEVQLTYADGALYGFPGIGLDFSSPAYLRSSTRYTDTIDDVHSETWDNVSGHLTLEYFPSEDHLAWAKIATGYKMGGFRLGALQNLATRQALEDAGQTVVAGKDYAAFEPEEVTMLELGWKATFNDIFQLDTAIFAYQYDNLQQLFSYVNGSGVTLSEVVNTDMEMFGLEVAADYLITDHWRIRGSYSYNTAEFTEDLVVSDSIYGTDVNINGNSAEKTPDHKVSMVLSYNIDTSTGYWYTGLTSSFVDDRYNDIFNREETILESYNRVDLPASWTSTTELFKITAAVKNLTDDLSYDSKSLSTASGVGLSSLQITGRPMRPRVWSLQFEYKY